MPIFSKQNQKLFKSKTHQKSLPSAQRCSRSLKSNDEQGTQSSCPCGAHCLSGEERQLIILKLRIRGDEYYDKTSLSYDGYAEQGHLT